MRTINKVFTLSLISLGLAACGGGDPGDKLTPTAAVTSSTAVFNPSAGAAGLPFPVDLAFAGSTDTSLNLPSQPNSVPAGADASLYNPGFIAMNTMDGFSTSASLVVRFSDDINGDSLAAGLRIFATDSKNPGPHFNSPFTIPTIAPDSTTRSELLYGIDYVAGVSGGSTVLITLLRPLDEDTTYIITANTSVQTTGATAVSRDDTYALLQTLAADESVYPTGVPVAFTDSGYTTACNVSSLATYATCVVNPALSAYHGNDLATAVQLETLRQITRNHLEAIAVEDSSGSVAASAADIVLSYSVTTQNVTTALDNAFAGAATPTLSVVDTTQDTPAGLANIYAGTLSGVTQFVDPANPNTSHWEGSQGGCPAATTNLVVCNGYVPNSVTTATLPVIITAPTDAVAGGLCGAFTELPVAIFQHGITSNRASLLAIADRLASACIVGVAIDLPKHGVSTTAELSGIDISGFSLGTLERLVATDAAGTGCADPADVTPDGSGGYHCESGDNFINLVDLANSRDTLRQSAVDLHSLYSALAADQLTGGVVSGVKDPDPANISFVGMSLGGVVGVPFAARETGLSTAVFNVAGGGIAKLLDGSPSFEPSITAGLYAAAGLSKPGGDYEGFMIIAQTLVDSADPINYAATLGGNIGAGTKVMMQEVAGSLAADDVVSCYIDGSPCPDQVVPNNVFGKNLGTLWGIVSQSGQNNYLPNQNFVTTPSALAGTDPLAQGTGFVALGTEAVKYIQSAGAIGVDPVLIAGIGPTFATGSFPATFITYKGVGLPSIGPCGAASGAGLVRFNSGDHSSLLSPAADPSVTYVMQRQVATFVAGGGANIVNDWVDTDENQVPDTSSGTVISASSSSQLNECT